MIIGNRHFEDRGRTYVMGILNVTPDSFSDGGKYNTLDASLKHVEQMIDEGADIIDIGGESTRPGFQLVGDEEELNRLVPVVEAVKKRFDIPVSVDTFHDKVAREVLDAGADMINDIWGLEYRENESSMAEIVAKYHASVCIMHNSEKKYTCENGDIEIIRGINDEIVKELASKIELAKKAGIDDKKIMIDPGVGFAKDYTVNMSMIANVDIFNKLGYPVLLGTSKKSAIGLTLDLPIDERVEGTLATTAYAVMKGCSYVRVHDVKSNVRLIKMMEAILKYRTEPLRGDKYEETGCY